MEEIVRIIDCGDGPCVLSGACRLEKVFRDAAELFVSKLDEYTLADLVGRPGRAQSAILRRLSL